MTRVLITAFEPYDCWDTNSSWLALMELVKDLPTSPEITTRLYPVDYSIVREKLAVDLRDDYDVALHLGQAPGSSLIQLEAFGINVAGQPSQSPEDYVSLSDSGPQAYRSQLPLTDWSRKLCQAGIPAKVSYHAGTYLCNATLYLSNHLQQKMKLKTKSTFIHLPLDISQAAAASQSTAHLPTSLAVSGLRLILDELAD